MKPDFKVTDSPARRRSFRLIKKEKRRNRNPNFLPMTWVSATSIRNAVLDNLLVDWLRFYGVQRGYKPIPNSNLVATPYIFKLGTLFEEKVIDYLTGSKKIKLATIAKNFPDDSYNVTKFEETKEAMKRGEPYIYQGVLFNYANKTYGVPDLIVRSDHINNLTTVPSVTPELAKTGSKYSSDWHYRIIDIKFSSLPLCSDKVHIRNEKNFKVYKTQLYVYNEALAALQEYNPNAAYILGRRWYATTRGTQESSNYIFDRLGTIDYANKDSDYATITADAIDLRKELINRGHEWTICPPSRPDLYPNMTIKTEYDGAWAQVKRELAEKNAELTQLYYVGLKNREFAFQNNIKRWDDPLCSAQLLNIKSPATAKIVNQMLKVNREQKAPIISFTSNVNQTLRDSWQTLKPNEFYIDFEVANDISFEDFSQIPNSINRQCIYLIGVTHLTPENKRTHKYFLAKTLTPAAEKEIVTDFINYINSFSPRATVYHWGHAEQSFYKSVSQRFPDLPKQQWTFADFCNVMRREPIVVKGCFGYGLKPVGKALHAANIIKTSWQDETAGEDTVMTIKKYAEESPTDLGKHPKIQQLIDYNKNDCQVMYEIVQALRLKLLK